ncbi:MAG: enoyl-CoA hydratase-related protein [Burkholderiales bacterium]|nr:enoyl-CoA hydratase-related protein [Burkholderiales bacterium]
MSSYQHIRYAGQAYEFIRYEVVDRIARVTLNRPDQVNVQSTAMLEELDHAIDTAGADHDVRVICLFGAGRHFSAGHDLGSSEERAHRERFPIEDGARGLFERNWRLHMDMHLRWRNVPKPLICAVQGYCIFGGWMVASTADVIFAADDALFLGSAFQYFSIPYDIHPRMAKELLFQGRFINARQARELGFVNRVVRRDQLEAETLAYAADVARNDPFDLRTTKMAINQAQDAQGFTAHIHNAFSTFMVRRIGSSDPGHVKPWPTEGKRLPMVEVALERYQQALARERSLESGPDQDRDRIQPQSNEPQSNEPRPA